MKKPKRLASVLSIGYEKLHTAAFMQTLGHHKVQAVVDVRESAFSRRLDFRKNKLVSLLRDNDIEYFHLRRAGNPHRKISSDIAECLRRYEEYILNEPTLLTELTNEFEQITRVFPRIAILCYEKCPKECHRTILINQLVEKKFQCSVIEV